VKELLDKGVKITEVKKMAAEFAIMPADGSYKVTFGDAEFEAYFKAFLRPKLVEMLFEGK
jgi:V/A-type H+-transporting ATPase subunit E